MTATLCSIGNVHSRMGQYDEGLKCYEQSLRIYTRALGPNHPYVAISLRCIGAAKRDMGALGPANDNFGKPRASWAAPSWK